MLILLGLPASVLFVVNTVLLWDAGQNSTSPHPTQVAILLELAPLGGLAVALVVLVLKSRRSEASGLRWGAGVFLLIELAVLPFALFSAAFPPGWTLY